MIRAPVLEVGQFGVAQDASEYSDRWRESQIRATVVPERRRMRRRISRTEITDRTCGGGRRVAEITWSISVPSAGIAVSTCFSSSFKISSAG